MKKEKKCLCGESINEKTGTTTGGESITYYPPKCEKCMEKISMANKTFFNQINNLK